MSDDDFDLVHGSGNVFRDFGYPDADVRQAKCLLAAEIMKILDARQWSTRKAEEATGISHADFTRIRKVSTDRFTLDRLMLILGKLGQDVELSVTVRPRPQANHPAPVHR
ncbi:MAG: helix-turn-helix domain-containing protein [Methylocella sp.]|nr:MAG: XRE family transcriptional regulator [Hyphomicrobiales bacterium]